jgi:drug/metabolite transporter (DMT)-like permease
LVDTWDNRNRLWSRVPIMQLRYRSLAPYRIAPIEDRRLLGIGLVLTAFLCFTTIDTSAKWMTTHGLPTLEVVFVRYAVHFALIAGLILPRYGRVLLRSGNRRLELLRGLVLLGSTIANFFAIRHLPLTVTGSILFSVPLIVCAVSVPLLGEHVGWRRWMAILVGFGGVLLIIRPGSEGFSFYVVFSLVAVTCYAFYIISNRMLAGVDAASTQQFYSALIATVCIAPFAFGKWMWPQEPSSWLAFAAIGVAGAVGHQIYTIAHRFAPASTLAPFIYAQIIYLTASSWLIFGQPPDVWIFAGAPLVIGSGLYIWLRERQIARTQAAVGGGSGSPASHAAPRL